MSWAGAPSFMQKVRDLNGFEVLFSMDNIYAVSEDFFDVANTEFYDYNDLQKVDSIGETPDG